MYTLLGTALGYLGSFFPEGLRLFRERQNKKYDLLIMDRKIEMMKLREQNDLKKSNIQADILETQALHQDNPPTDLKIVEALRASVRPVLTYAFFSLFIIVKISGLYLLINKGNVNIASALLEIWDNETASLFAAIMSFWFGQRTIHKFRTMK